MNDRQLRYVLAIAREQNLTAASKSLFIAQPSLSNMLDGIEKELGTKLFFRCSNGMKLTPAGEVYVETAQKILSAVSDMEQRIDNIKSETTGRLRIGASGAKSAVIFPYILPRLREQFPLYTIEYYENSMEHLGEKINAGELDVAFMYSDKKYQYTATQPLADEEICLVAPKSFYPEKLTPNSDGTWTLTDMKILHNASFVIFKQGMGLRKFADNIFQEIDFQPNIVLETSNWQTCLAMIKNDNALSFLPAFSLEAYELTQLYDQNFRYIRIGKPRLRTLNICYRESLEGTKIFKALTDICNEVVRHRQEQLKKNYRIMLMNASDR